MSLLTVFSPIFIRYRKVGDRIQLKNLSSLLQRISSEGIEAFYSGDNLKDMLNTVNSNGGNITENDFKDYQALEEGVHHILFGGTLM